MDYEIRVERAEPRTIASVHRRAAIPQLSAVVPAACGEVWGFIRAAGIPHPGRNVAVYRNCEGGVLDAEVGVEVAAPFSGDRGVSCSATPAGTVAATLHRGPYHRLGEANEAILRWCRENGRNPAGPSWEIYGHWTDDPEKLETEVYYLLED